MSVDVRLIAIVDPASVRDPLGMVCAAEAGGATAVQIRMKNNSASVMLDWARRFITALAVPVYVNDRADVAWAAGAVGVHVGADDPSAVALRDASPPHFRIGVSVGDEHEADAFRHAAADYWSVGAMYHTRTKSDAGPPIGPTGLSRLARLAPQGIPIVGIGGITLETASAVMAAGASGIAVSSAIFGGPDPETAARRLRDAVDAAGRVA